MADSNQLGGGRGWPILIAVAGGVVGLLLGAVLGAVLGGIHLYLFWRGGGEGAGTEVALVPLYAIAAAIVGAIAGLISGAWLGRRRQKRSGVEVKPTQAEPCAAADRGRDTGLRG